MNLILLISSISAIEYINADIVAACEQLAAPQRTEAQSCPPAVTARHPLCEIIPKISVAHDERENFQKQNEPESRSPGV